ncbi:PaaI family thioesterase [Croceimicrobium hydrocarbonivorans]|uniref:Hotdog fold thioesterase n=1 Tax=Croceimicrobium hydrocarbonivorans TaxID=2761580 RepID=A0A7H0VDG0_9FLAO|nr:hotdog fold thioesterase [Croceimicrobium hydrocarbonivorans]QNR23758.1 hotdog fold thioesterase [Croceimicrobium hydrocarbonivorans]
MNKEEVLALFAKGNQNTLMETLNIEYTDVSMDPPMLKATMPVNSRVHQPMGLLHGGATAALAESLGSAASFMLIDREHEAVVGIELSCNHLRSIREGMVYGTARILHQGKSTHLWEIEVRDAEDRLISHCKLTNMILQRSKLK